MTVHAAGAVRFDRLLRVLAALSSKGFHQVALTTPAASEPFRMRGPLASSETLRAEGVAHAVLNVRVVREGVRVDPNTGKPWSGDGPYRYDGRVLMFAKAVYNEEGGSSAFGGYEDSVPGLELPFTMLSNNGTSKLLVVPEPNVEWRDLNGLLELARQQGLEPHFGLDPQLGADPERAGG